MRSSLTTLIWESFLSSEYVFTEVPPGTVVIAGLPKMYYGSAVMSIGAALNQARQKENERARFEADAGKTYYFKWTAGAMATMIKVTPVDPSVGAKEISKLHPSKPPNDKEECEAGNDRYREATSEITSLRAPGADDEAWRVSVSI